MLVNWKAGQKIPFVCFAEPVSLVPWRLLLPFGPANTASSCLCLYCGASSAKGDIIRLPKPAVCVSAADVSG